MPRDEWVVSLHPSEEMYPGECVLLLQDLRLLQSCSRGGGGEWRTCAMRDDEPRPVWMSLPITH